MTGATRRLGVLIFENLSSDTSLDWIGRAAASVVANQISAPSRLQAVELLSIRDAASADVNETVQGYFSVVGGTLRLAAQVGEAGSRKLITSEGPISAGILPLADNLARQISPAVNPYPTKSETALREYFQGVSANSPEQLMAHMELAQKADPAYGAAYLARLQLLISKGDKEGAKAVLAEASQHSKNFAEVDRARLGMIQASLGGTQAEQSEALTNLVAATPNDIPAINALANLQITAKNFPAAVKTLQSGLKIEPSNVVLLNSLAYTQAFAGDYNAALASLASYGKLAPNDANVSDTTAEVYFVGGKFQEAERAFLDAHQRNKALLNGGELYRAAVAALLAGNRKAADEHMKEYFANLTSAKDPLVPVRQAIWANQAGDKSSVSQLEKFASEKDTQPEAASVARSQLALWRLSAGEREKAQEEVKLAMSLAGSAGSKNFAGVSAFLAAPKASAAEWKQRTERIAPAQTALRRQILGYALMLGGDYSEAEPVWKSIYGEAGLDGMGESKVFLAYCYAKAGRKKELADLMKTGVLPPKTLDPGVPSLVLPYYVYVRSQLN